MISVQNVSKRYPLYRHAVHRMLAMAGISAKATSEFWALRDVSFEVARGEAVGIIGPNGSGKSTLLQVISGILQPTTGRALCQGRIAALLELGAGFNPEFTGRENVFLSGEIMGVSRADMEAAFRKIEAFAEIGTFIDRPVKEYSTGMYVRLAFSTAIHVEPEVLIVGEALSVGDAVFAARCVQKFEELRKRKVTVLFVSHDLGLVKRLCERAIFMLNGQVVLDGPTRDAVNRYVGFVLEREDPNKPLPTTPAIGSSFRHGDGASRIVSVQMLGAEGREATTFLSGEPMTIRLRAEFDRPMDNPVVGILIRNRVGIDVFGTNTRIEGVELGCYVAGEVLEVEFQMDCILSRQEYTLTVATQYPNGLSQDWLDDAIAFSVVDPKDIAGVLNMKTKVEFTRLKAPQPVAPDGPIPR